MWARWLNAGRWVDGFPDHSTMFGSSRTGLTWEDWEEDADQSLAESVDAAVRDLPQVERAAVFATKTGCAYPHGIALEFAYDAACQSLLATLTRRGVYVATGD